MFEVLLAGMAVADFGASRNWYVRLFGREPDVVAHDTEVMWKVADRAWVYVKEEAERAGGALLTLAVSELEDAIRALSDRGLEPGPVKPQGDAGWKSIISDPDGNQVALIQVATA